MMGLAAAGAGELSGYVSVEGRGFFNDALYSGQERDNGSIAAEPEYYHEWDNGSSFTFVPFARLDSADSERTHMDIRELNYLYREDIWFFRLGVGKVFWGATEFVHLVDIVNQTDLVEHIDGEDKLGQPMFQFGISPSWGNIDVFIMPYFRERTFPGQDGRLRTSRVVDVDDAIYESSSEQSNTDLAIRYSHTLGSADFGVYLFRGTSREPLLATPDMIDPNDTDDSRLIPFYEQINQFGTDVQVATGNWLWKWEAYLRNGYFQNYFATIGGFEYTFFDVAGSGQDIGVLSEYSWNDRDDGGMTLFQNDLFAGQADCVESMQEFFLSRMFVGEKVNIVDGQQVCLSHLAAECLKLSEFQGKDELVGKLFSREVEQICLGAIRANGVADSLQQMGLSDAISTVDEQGVERTLLFVDNDSGGVVGQLV